MYMHLPSEESGEGQGGLLLGGVKKRMLGVLTHSVKEELEEEKETSVFSVRPEQRIPHWYECTEK